MATQREIIYTIKTILRGGLITDDDRITDRQVAFMIDNVRATLLRQQYNKGQNLSDNNIQTITCMEVEQVDTSFMPDFPSGCAVYKTVLSIPKPIESKGKDLITGITGPNLGGVTFDFIPYARVPYASYTRFKKPLVTLFNNHLYFLNHSGFMMNVAVSGVFEQPNELASYNNCEGQPCFDWDSNYPMSSHLIDAVIQMVTNELTLTLKTYQDRTNSGAHEFETQFNSNVTGKLGAAATGTKKKSSSSTSSDDD
jgi:hypothetical protein